MDEESSDGLGDDLSEADDVSVPRQVAGSLLEVSDAPYRSG